MVLNLNLGRRHYSTHRKGKSEFSPLINVAQNKKIFRENRKRNKNDRTEAKKHPKIDPVHQLLINGLPPPKPLSTAIQPQTAKTNLESVKPMPTSSTNILPPSSSVSVQPKTQKPTPLRSELNSNTIQKKDNLNDAVLKNQNERPKEAIPTVKSSPSKKPALKDMMKMFDFNCSDSDSE